LEEEQGLNFQFKTKYNLCCLLVCKTASSAQLANCNCSNHACSCDSPAAQAQTKASCNLA